MKPVLEWIEVGMRDLGSREQMEANSAMCEERATQETEAHGICSMHFLWMIDRLWSLSVKD